MNSLDLVIIGILALFVFLGARRGFMDEVLGLSGWIIAVVCAVKFGGILAVYITRKVPQLHMFSSVLAGLLLLFGIRYLFLLLITMIKKSAPKMTDNIFNKIMGATLGVVQGLLLMSLMVLVLWLVPFGHNVKALQEKSVLMPHMESVTQFLLNSVGNFVPPARPLIDKIYDKIDGTVDEGLTPDDIAPLKDKVRNISDNPPVDKKTRQELKEKVEKLDKELRR